MSRHQNEYDRKIEICIWNGRKLCWKWRKYIFPQYFQHLLHQDHLKLGVCGEGTMSYYSLVNPIRNKPLFSRVCSKSLSENTMGKGEIALHFKEVWIYCFYMLVSPTSTRSR